MQTNKPPVARLHVWLILPTYNQLLVQIEMLKTCKLITQTSICDLSAIVQAIGQSVFCSIAAPDISLILDDTESLVHQKFTGRFSGAYCIAVKLMQRP